MARSRDDDEDDDDRPRRRRRPRDDDDDFDDRPRPRRRPRGSGGGLSPLAWVGIGGGGLLLLLVCAGIGVAVLVARGTPNLSADNVARIRNGMTQAEVERILGTSGRVVTRVHLLGQEHKRLEWDDGRGTNVAVTFIDDRVMGVFRVQMR